VTVGSRPAHDGDGTRREGIGAFLRNLLSGIPWSECTEAHSEQHFPSPQAKQLRIENGNGRTRVVGEERSDIAVRIHKRARAETDEAATRLLEAIRIESHEEDGTLSLEVTTPRKWNRHGHANLEIHVPHGTQVTVLARNGKICLDGLRSCVRARSSNGSVHVSDVVGDVAVETSNAKVACSCICGRLVARSSNGKIEVVDHRGSLDASTSNGLIRASLGEMGSEGVVLATSNGRIVLDLPESVDADVDLRVDNGVIRAQRELQTRSGESTGRLRGRLGRGGTPIKLRTSNGTISLR